MEFSFEREVVAPTSKLRDLALEDHGSKVIFATDEFFGLKENLIKSERPTQKLSSLDAWVTKRRRSQGHDFSIIKLGRIGVIKEIAVDTSFMDGMVPSFFSIDYQKEKEFSVEEKDWEELLPMKPLTPNCALLYRLNNKDLSSFIRLNIYPDGGVARLRLMGY